MRTLRRSSPSILRRPSSEGRSPDPGAPRAILAPGGAAPEEEAPAASATRTIVLVGNPNVGKSLLFKNLTRRHVVVANFPGTTVETVRARASFNGRDTEVVDTPGINDLAGPSEDARVTREILTREDDVTLVQVADAKNLRRALLLTLQLAELGRPMVLVLNMLDELEQRGARIDIGKLGQILGIPVVGTVATRNRGTRELTEALSEAHSPRLDPRFLDKYTEAWQKNRARLACVNEVLAETYTMDQPSHASLGVRLGFWAIHPVKGLAFLALVLAAVFWFVGLFGAGSLVNLLEVAGFEQQVSPRLIRLVDRVTPFPHVHRREAIPFTFGLPLSPVHEVELASWQTVAITPDYTVTGPLSPSGEVARFVHDLLVGPYGAITMALSYALAIVLPIVATFFLLFSLLEDSGYLPRMSILVNRVFRLMGLNGKSVLPMILGLGCDTMATMTTRILETRKERIVTTMLLALAVPCSAQLGVLLAMMASLSLAAALFWVALMTGIVLLVGWLTARLFDRGSSDFLLEIPPMRRPQMVNVVSKTVLRLEWYLKEVIPLFLLGTVALFLLDRLGVLGRLAEAAEPLVTGWLGLPKEAANAFLIGFLRRDFGAVYLLEAATGPAPQLSPHQILVAMITITLFMPCFANFLMIGKEHGMKVAWAMAGFVFPFAFLVGGLVHHFAAVLGL